MKAKARTITTQVISLPEVAFTAEGAEFHPQDDFWKVADSSAVHHFKFDQVKKLLTTVVLRDFKYVVSWYLQNHSTSHAKNLFMRFCQLIRSFSDDRFPVSRIETLDIINFKSKLNVRTEYLLGALGGFFKKWHDLNLETVDPSIPKFFNEVRIRGNMKGEAVSTMDPETGPFTDLELQSISLRLNAEFAAGNITTEDYLLVILTMIFGVRPKQLASLKIQDLSAFHADDGSPLYILNVPRAKQRSTLSRSQLKPRTLIPELGKLLEAWLHHLAHNFERGEVPVPELPLFPRKGNPMPPSLAYHATAQQLGHRIILTCNRLNVQSERTGKKVKIFPRRFRHTTATRAAEEGHGELIIADLLDHSDTQNVGVYVQATPAMTRRIDKATALELAPIAQSFMGLIVQNETFAQRGDDFSSRIGSPDLGSVGSCGKYGFCDGQAPISCYTCRNFQPWLEAPHEDLLDSLVAERERIHATTNDERMAAINDHTILAVADVVNRCNLMKPEKNIDRG
ncbi:site-specific integrase [Puniceibacterium sediminis]|uniref:Phage integrase family protein n=1 Tax=Puniceibacterium sediminis TaxID=1608407 RepID=A0A238VZS8_9RHOB|nr:site-specific integrase [Puniceibacterium sediminis]SNR39766.1 Phage integrase family protein [Puniceibacterium sediminis]